VLLAFAIAYEHESNLSLAIGANVLRVLDERGVRVRDLPRLSGVSKEAISMALGILRKGHLTEIAPDPAGGRAGVVCLTQQGRAARDAYRRLLGDVEERWLARFGAEAIGALRQPLERLIGDATAPTSPLVRGLPPYPEGWRASVPAPDTLPHYPMVLHRGGFPDGS
jgi:DNA-binding MarR family transcriptional regulator